MSTPKWKLVETVVTAIESAEPGAKVTPNAKVRSRTTSGETRQVDVYVETNLGRRPIRMGIEVKDEASPLDITVVEQVAAKLADLDVDLRWLVSTSNFTAGARSKAQRMGLCLSTMQEVEDPAWLSTIRSMTTNAELIHIRINYEGGATDAMRAQIASVNLDDVVLATRNGDVSSIRRLAFARLVAALDEIETPPTEQKFFEVQLDPPSDHWEALVIGNDRFPPPANVRVVYRCHQKTADVEMRAYRLGEREIRLTADPIEIFGKRRHLGFLLEPTDNGGSKLKLTFTDANPPPVVVGEAADD